MKRKLLSLLLVGMLVSSAQARGIIDRNIDKILDEVEVVDADGKNLGAAAGFTIAAAGAASVAMSFYFYKQYKSIDPLTTNPALRKRSKRYLVLAWTTGLAGLVSIIGGTTYGISSLDDDSDDEEKLETPHGMVGSKTVGDMQELLKEITGATNEEDRNAAIEKVKKRHWWNRKPKKEQ